MSKLKNQLKEKFDYDVALIPAWTDNTMPNVITDLIENSTFLSKLTVEEGIKGTKEIALLNADIALQAKVACTPSPDGSVIFTKENLTTVPLYMGIEFCNEDLNGKMTQVLNVLGLKRQDGQLPAALNEILMAYLMKQAQRKAQRLAVSGDTTSLDAELVLMNGLRQRLVNDADVLTYNAADATMTDSNAYTQAYGVYKAIPTELFDNGMEVAIYTGRTEAQKIIAQWNTSNPYDRIVFTEEGASLSFVLPQTAVKVITLPELNGKSEMYAIPLSLVFLGVDSPEDMSFDVKYNEYTDQLKAEASFRLGIAHVWGQYFVRLHLLNS